jgi:ribulose-phosphate 3-epimerase
LPLATHLMISNPDLFLHDFAEAGADAILVHWEGNNNLSRTVQSIQTLDKSAGVVINPATPRLSVRGNLEGRKPSAVMTVNPGFGHQHRGIDATTAPLVVNVGANVLVAGSAIFNDTESTAAAVKRLLESVHQRIT